MKNVIVYFIFIYSDQHAKSIIKSSQDNINCDHKAAIDYN